MLAVGAWLPEVDDSSLPGDNLSLLVDPFAVAFHIKLLDVRCQLAEGLAVGNYRSRAVASDRRVVKAN